MNNNLINKTGRKPFSAIKSSNSFSPETAEKRILNNNYEPKWQCRVKKSLIPLCFSDNPFYF